MPSPAITGPAVSSSGGEGKEISQPEPVKEIGLSVAQSEIKNIRIRTSEAETKPAEISKPVLETLVSTITFNLEIFDEIPEAQRPAILKDFIDLFKAQNPELKDIKDKAKVREAAEKFLSEGGGKAVLAAFKVMEWEASLLHGASGARFDGKDPKTASKDGETDIVFIDPKTGVLTTQKVDSRGWWKRLVDRKDRKDVRGEKKLKINTTLVTGVGSQITDASDIAYLDKCGWVNGTNIQIAANREILFKRLFSVAQARSELFSETGLTVDEITQRLNFVDNTGRLKIAGREAHFIGEVSGGYTSAEFTSEAHTIIDKIKTDTLEKLTKLKKESAETRIGGQIEKKIEDLRKDKEEMTSEQIEAEQEVIKQEIGRLEKEARLLTTKKLLPGEIEEAEKALDEVVRLVDERQGRIVPLVAGETIDLIAWSDPSSPESWGARENVANNLEAQRAAINAEIADLQAEINSEREHRPKEEILSKKIMRSKDSAGNDVETIEEPDQDVKDEFNASRTREEALRTEIKNRKRSRDIDDIGSGMSLSQTINELRTQVTRRKQIVEEDPDTKELLEKYREAVRLLKQKNDERTVLDPKIDALKITPAGAPSGETDEQLEARLRANIKKKGKEKESVGKASLDDQREVSALSLIKEVITDEDKKGVMEQRLLDHEVGAYEDLEVSPELSDYPKVVLQTVKLMFGPEALSAVGNSEIYQRAKALLESQWYVKIIIEQIENQNRVAATDKVAFTASRIPGGQNQEITMANLRGLIIGKSIDTLGKDLVSEATIRKIIDEIRKSALGYI